MEAGLGHDPDDVYTEYNDPMRDSWRALVMPVLKHIPAKELAAATELSERSIKAIRNQRQRPRDQLRVAPVRAAGNFARRRLQVLGEATPHDDLAACAAYSALADEPKEVNPSRCRSSSMRSALVAVRGNR